MDNQKLDTCNRVPARCHDCAFTYGTNGNLSNGGWFLQKAELCAMAGDWFFCHVRREGGDLVPCMGWAERLIELHPTDEATLKWKRGLAAYHLELMGEVEAKTLTGEQALQRTLAACGMVR